MSVPWILHIDILRLIVSLKLYVRRYMNVLPISAVCVVFVETVRRFCHIFCIVEFPDAIQRFFQTLDVLYKLGFAHIILVVGVCRYSILLIKQGIFYFILHLNALLFESGMYQPYFHYITHNDILVFIIIFVSCKFVFLYNSDNCSSIC